MGALFTKQQTLKEVIRENQRMLKKAVRELEREIGTMQSQEKKIIADIKKAAKQNQTNTMRILAKDLVRSRNYIQRFIEMKAHLNAVGLKMQTIKSNEAMAEAMKGVTKALVAMNKKISLPGLQKMMTEFMTENERSEVMQEAIGDTLDDAFEEDGAAAEEDRIVSQVLDELGVGVNQDVPEAPKTAMTMPAAAPAETRIEEKVASDAGVSELEERLKNLKQK